MSKVERFVATPMLSLCASSCVHTFSLVNGTCWCHEAPTVPLQDRLEDTRVCDVLSYARVPMKSTPQWTDPSAMDMSTWNVVDEAWFDAREMSLKLRQKTHVLSRYESARPRYTLFDAHGRAYGSGRHLFGMVPYETRVFVEWASMYDRFIPRVVNESVAP